MSDTLKPCPLCGGEAILDEWENRKQFWVECMDCKAMGPNCEGPTGARAAWNLRPAYKPEWRPISEAPTNWGKDMQYYYLMVFGPKTGIKIILFSHLDYEAKMGATHWQPLPEPPKEA